MTPGSIELDALGDSVRVSAVVRDADGAEIEGAEVNWTSTDPAVVTVNSAGWVVAVGNGAARVVATIGELADSVSVDVEQRPASVQASPEQIRLGVGDTLRLEAVVLDANDHPIAGAEVTWRSTVPSDVSVDSTGLVEALTWGASARVIASSGEFSDTVSVGGKDQIVVTTATGFALINDDGTNFHEIGGHRGRNPTWAPASNKLAYLTVVGQPGYRLFMLDELDGTATPRLVAPAEAAQTVHWSSKGKIIFDFKTYDIHRKIVVVNPDGSGLQDVAADAYENSDPAWSPDGRHFVYVSQRDSAHLVVANDDGSGKTSLVKSSGRLFSPVWTLNGQEIVYTRYASSTYTLYRVNVTTGVTTELGPGRYAERASLGNRIAAVDKNAESGAWELYIYDLNANTMTTHTLSVPVSDRPLWSPDNQKLLLSTGDSLLVFHLDRGEEDIVAAAGMDLHSARSFAWRPRKPLVIVPQL